MKPAAFRYVRARSVEHAVRALSEADGGGKIIAGGQSLMPMMNFRLVKPSVLVDINAIPGLDTIQKRDGKLLIGALVRHRMTATDPFVAEQAPVLREAMKHVAHLTVRNRGTFCGSICHADPAAECPMIARLLNGMIHIASPREERRIPSRDFFTGSLMTALEQDELVTGVEIDTLPAGTGWGFEEFARRHGDYALAAAAVTMRWVDGQARDVRISLTGVADTPVRMPEAEAALEGSMVSSAKIDESVEALRAAITPNSDNSASSDFRRHLTGAVVRRAVNSAWTRAAEGRAP